MKIKVVQIVTVNYFCAVIFIKMRFKIVIQLNVRVYFL